ncbi:hypothetical protein [Acinetobacter sp. CFCC 11171]|uniref:hypothetical protein n=1 Tax=Acinetobacter sp. CFCC 11171 TaxID=1775558 RepID=UPI000DD0B524|nr:hypothetical protein [Acinetobacter sp. CFCC 11171]
MLKKILLSVSLLSFVPLTYAMSPLTKLPQLNNEMTISVSSDSISKFRYGAMRDKSLPNAQVLIGLPPTVGGTMGLPFAEVIGLTIAHNNVSNSKTANRGLFLQQKKFDQLVTEKLKIKLMTSNPSFVFNNNEKTDIQLIPYVFVSSDKTKFYIDFTIAMDINKKTRMYRYRSEHFSAITEIDEDSFDEVSTYAFDRIFDLLFTDLSGILDFSQQDLELQVRCEKISGKKWGVISPFNVNFKYIKNPENLCIANVRDTLGVEFMAYPMVYIIEDNKNKPIH